MQMMVKGVMLASTETIPMVTTITRIPTITTTTLQKTHSTITNSCNFNTSLTKGTDPSSQKVSQTTNDCETKHSANTIDSIDNRSQEIVPTSSNSEQQSDNNDGAEPDSNCYTPKQNQQYRNTTVVRVRQSMNK